MGHMTTATDTTTQTPEQWADAFTQASDADAEISAHGTYFTCSYLLDMDTHSFVVETWQGFGVPVPAPMFHGIWAASFQRDMRLEGDVLVLMQNLRCVTRQIELLRAVGVPV